MAKNIKLFSRRSTSSNLIWESKKSQTKKDVTYTKYFKGTIETDAEKLHIETVRGRRPELINTTNSDAKLTRKLFKEIHNRQLISTGRPTRAASIVIAMAVTMATSGIGAIAGTKVAALVGCKSAISTAVATNATSAAVTSLSVQATAALLRCNGDFAAAAKALASTDTLKNIALSAATSGAMAGAGEALNQAGLPAVKDAHSLGERLAYAAPRQAANASIKTLAHVAAGQKFEDAVLYNLRSAAAGTVGAACANQIGDAYGKEQIDPVMHKVLHTAVGATEGAIIGGPSGALAGGTGALIAETVSDIFTPEKPSLEKINALEVQAGRTLTQEEFVQAWNDQLKTYMQGVSSAAENSKLIAATIAMLTRQDVGIAHDTAATAVDNNFVFLATCGVITASVAYSAYEIHNAYKQGGSKAALKQLGIEVITYTAGFAIGRVGGKVLFKVGAKVYPTVKVAVTAALESKPGLKLALGKFVDTIIVASEKFGQSVVGKQAARFGKSVSRVEAHLISAKNKTMQKIGLSATGKISVQAADHSISSAGIAKAELKSGVQGVKGAVKNSGKTVGQTGNITTKRSVYDLIKVAKPGRQTSIKKTQQYEVKGGFKEALKDFEALQPRNVRDISSVNMKKKMGFLEDGRKVIIRETCSSGPNYNGRPTLEIQSGDNRIKFRYMR